MTPNRDSKTNGRLKLWINLGVVAVVLLGIAAFYMTVLWLSDWHVEHAIAAVKASGAPTTVRETFRPLGDPAQNADVLLRPHYDRIRQEMHHFRFDDPLFPWQIPDTQRQRLQDCEATLAAISAASALPEWNVGARREWPDRDWGADLLMSAARMLHYAGVVALIDSDRNAALTRALQVWRLGVLLEQEGCEKAYRVNVKKEAMELANAVVRSGPVEPALLQELEMVLAVEPDMKGLERVLRAARATSIEDGTKLRSRVFLVATDQWADFCMPQRKINAERMWDLRYIEQYLALLHQPFPAIAHKWQQLVQEIDEKLKEKESYFERAYSARPDLLTDHFDRIAQARCLRVLIAHIRTGKSNLHELGLPTEAITDPYTGKPLQWKPSPTGGVIYSLGHELKDGSTDYFGLDGIGLKDLPPEPRR